MFLRALALIVAVTSLMIATLPASAQTPPTNPGDFSVNMNLGGEPAAGATPTCDPSLDSIAALFLSGQTSVNAAC